MNKHAVMYRPGILCEWEEFERKTRYLVGTSRFRGTSRSIRCRTQPPRVQQASALYATHPLYGSLYRQHCAESRNAIMQNSLVRKKKSWSISTNSLSYKISKSPRLNALLFALQDQIGNAKVGSYSGHAICDVNDDNILAEAHASTKCGS
jgi:hypothetical protein